MQQNPKRIWPFRDLLGVLPDHVVLPKDKERPVDGEAVLSDRDGVVQGHGACTLRFGLLEGWGDATCGHGRPIAASDTVGASIPRAEQARNIVPESGHSVQGEQHGKEDSVRQETGPEMSLQQSWARCCARRESTGDPGDPFSPSPLLFTKISFNSEISFKTKTKTKKPQNDYVLRSCSFAVRSAFRKKRQNPKSE